MKSTGFSRLYFALVYFELDNPLRFESNYPIKINCIAGLLLKKIMTTIV